MAKNKGAGCVTKLLFFAFVLFLGIYFLMANALDFKTLFIYGPGQYFSNIGHFHSDHYCKVKSNFHFYDEILPVSSLKDKTQLREKFTLSPGDRFKLKGYREKEFVIWIAAKVANGPDYIYGYFMLPEKVEIPTFTATLSKLTDFDSQYEPFSNKYFAEISQKTTDQYRNRLRSTFKEKLRQKVSLKKTTEPTKMQEISESDNYKIIEEISSENVKYYCPSSEYPMVEELYDAFLGDNFDAHYLQVKKNYSPGKDGTFKVSLFFRIIDTWYFKLFICLLLLGILKRIRKGSKQTGNSQGEE